jgi:DNA-binding XRE family transcriptional regulator
MNLIKIKNKMCQLEMTQEDLAKEVGVHYSTVYRWLSGERKPLLRNKTKIAEVLEITVEELES